MTTGTGYLLGILIVFEFAGGDLCFSTFGLSDLVCVVARWCPEINLSTLGSLGDHGLSNSPNRREGSVGHWS